MPFCRPVGVGSACGVPAGAFFAAGGATMTVEATAAVTAGRAATAAAMTGGVTGDAGAVGGTAVRSVVTGSGAGWGPTAAGGRAVTGGNPEAGAGAGSATSGAFGMDAVVPGGATVTASEGVAVGTGTCGRAGKLVSFGTRSTSVVTLFCWGESNSPPGAGTVSITFPEIVHFGGLTAWVGGGRG